MTTELSAYASEVFGTAGLPEKTDLEVLFVAPIGDAVPEDGVFTYTTINSLSDIGLVKARSVILFREDQADALTVLGRSSEQFARTVQPLFGVPGGNYGVWFDDATFGLDRIAYGAFVAELRAAEEIASQAKSAGRSGTEIESDRYTTASGRVRFADSISTAVEDDSNVDE